MCVRERATTTTKQLEPTTTIYLHIFTNSNEQSYGKKHNMLYTVYISYCATYKHFTLLNWGIFFWDIFFLLAKQKFICDEFIILNYSGKKIWKKKGLNMIFLSFVNDFFCTKGYFYALSNVATR
jgi:hypothetical protein